MSSEDSDFSAGQETSSPTARPEPAQQPPNRLHPISLLFDLIHYIRTNIIPALVGVSGAATGSMFGIWLAGIIFIPTVLAAVIRYVTLRYGIREGELIVTEGLFFRRLRTVPVSKIQNVDMVQNVLHRLFKVAEVRIETASGMEAEASLRVLSMKQVADLRAEIFLVRAGQSAAAEQAGPPSAAESAKVLLQIPLNWLARAGIASGRGMIILGLIVGTAYQFNTSDFVDLNRLRKIIPTDISTTETAVASAIVIVAALVLLRLLSIVWFVLRFYGYQLSSHGNELRISCGLFTKLSATIPRRRIQFISVHRSLAMRWMGLATVRIETAGGAGNRNEDAATVVSRRWFVPVIPQDRVPELIAELRPGLVWDETRFDWVPLSPHAARRLVRLAVIQGMLLAGLGLVWTRPWGWTAGIALLPALIWWALKKSRSMRYAQFQEGVIYRSGILTRKTSVTFFEKIQTLGLHQSPLDRRWRMARLRVDTAAAGPAEHQIDVPLLDESVARKEFEELVQRAASYLPAYG